MKICDNWNNLSLASLTRPICQPTNLSKSWFCFFVNCSWEVMDSIENEYSFYLGCSSLFLALGQNIQSDQRRNLVLALQYTDLINCWWKRKPLPAFFWIYAVVKIIRMRVGVWWTRNNTRTLPCPEPCFRPSISICLSLDQSSSRNLVGVSADDVIMRKTISTVCFFCVDRLALLLHAN